MTEQEQKDLAELKERISHIRKEFFNHARRLLVVNSKVKRVGYDTVESAIVSNFKYYMTEIDKLKVDYLKKHGGPSFKDFNV